MINRLTLNLFAVSFLFLISCNSDKKIKIVEPYKLHSKIQKCFNSFKERYGIVGLTGFNTCYVKDNECLTLIRNEASIKDLLYMEKDSLISNEFKLLLWSEILKKDSIIGNTILEKNKNDTTKITRNTSCLGIVFTRSIEDEIKLLSGKYYLDLFSNKLMKEKLTR